MRGEERGGGDHLDGSAPSGDDARVVRRRHPHAEQAALAVRAGAHYRRPVRQTGRFGKLPTRPSYAPSGLDEGGLVEGDAQAVQQGGAPSARFDVQETRLGDERRLAGGGPGQPVRDPVGQAQDAPDPDVGVGAVLPEPSQLGGREEEGGEAAGRAVDTVAQLLVDCGALEDGAKVEIRPRVHLPPGLVEEDDALPLTGHGDGGDALRRVYTPQGDLYLAAQRPPERVRVEGAGEVGGVRLIHVAPRDALGVYDAPLLADQQAAQPARTGVEDEHVFASRHRTTPPG